MSKKLPLFLATIFILSKSLCQIPAGEVLWLMANQNVFADKHHKIAQWKDNSPYGNDVMQSSSTHQPMLVNKVFGNKPAVFFDGIHGKYFLSNQISNLTDAGSARTVFIVGLLDSAAVANGGGDFPSAGGTMFTFRRSSPVFAVQTARIKGNYYAYTGGLGTNSNASTNKGYYLKSKQCKFIDAFVSSGAGTYLRVRQNGVDVPVSQPNSIVSDWGSTGFTVGNREDYSGQDWQGYIAEIIVYNRELDSVEIAQTETYLSTKYHHCFSLPSDTTALNTKTTSIHVTLYPNPVNNNLVINGLPKTGKIFLRISDLTGTVEVAAEVINSSKFVLDVSKIRKGNHILYVECNGTVTSTQFVKQ